MEHHYTSDDVLHGAKQIARFLYGSSERTYVRKVYYLKETGRLPHFYMNRQKFCSQKSALTQWVSSQVTLQSAA